jgi:MFS family permease
MFCVQVDFFALNLALPRMAVDLNETTTNMQWVISAYMIAVGAAMIPGGRLGDLRGHRRIVVAGLVVFGGASLVCGLSSSYGLLIGFRALQGLGAAALFTVSVAAISNAVAKDHRAVAIGALFGIANIGTALGPFIGGLLTSSSVGAGCSSSTFPSAAVPSSAVCDGCPRCHPRGRRCGSIGWG